VQNLNLNGIVCKRRYNKALSGCAEPNYDPIEYIIRIKSAKLKKDVMEHHNAKGIAIEHIQIKPHNQFKIALQLRACIKKSKFL
jgi:hypothetical protein